MLWAYEYLSVDRDVVDVLADNITVTDVCCEPVQPMFCRLARIKCWLWQRWCRCVVVAVFAHPLAQCLLGANEAWSVDRDVCRCVVAVFAHPLARCLLWADEAWSVDTDVCRCVVLAGKSACVGYGDGAVKLWDLASGNALHSWQHATMPGQYLQFT